MSELNTSNHDSPNHATIDAIREDMATRSPEEVQAKLEDGLDMMLEDREENSEFFRRMTGVAALRDTVRIKESEEVSQVAHQLYGTIGYDTTPRNTGDIQHANEVYQVARQVHGPIGYDADKKLRSRNTF